MTPHSSGVPIHEFHLQLELPPGATLLPDGNIRLKTGLLQRRPGHTTYFTAMRPGTVEFFERMMCVLRHLLKSASLSWVTFDGDVIGTTHGSRARGAICFCFCCLAQTIWLNHMAEALYTVSRPQPLSKMRLRSHVRLRLPACLPAFLLTHTYPFVIGLICNPL